MPIMPRPLGSTRPLKVTRQDRTLECRVRRVVGYVSSCDECDWHSPTCSTVRFARLSLEMHQLYRHGELT